MTISGWGPKWIGARSGWVYVDRGGFDASNKDWVDWREVPDEVAKIKLIHSDNHARNFLDSVKSRKPTITTAETGYTHSAVPGHQGLISMLVGRKIKWDVKKEKILDDHDATKLMTRDFRSPWRLA